MAHTALQGNPVQLSGDLPAVGSSAPDFSSPRAT
jgi:thiol peroxidase